MTSLAYRFASPAVVSQWIGNDITERRWAKIEDGFRPWSLHIYCQKSFADESDATARFAKAPMAPSRPIRDRQAVIDWYHNGPGKRRGRITTGATERPPCEEAVTRECA